MPNEICFITEEQRNELCKALNILKGVFEDITIDYEDYSIIKTSIWYVEKSINYKKEYY